MGAILNCIINNAPTVLITLLISGVTGFFTGLFAYHFQLKKDIMLEQYKIYREIYQKIYAPIYKKLNVDRPEDGHKDLNDADVTYILEICTNNFLLIDPKLEELYFTLRDDYNWSDNKSNIQYEFDQNHEFADYIDSRYKYLQKKIYSLNGINETENWWHSIKRW